MRFDTFSSISGINALKRPKNAYPGNILTLGQEPVSVYVAIAFFNVSKRIDNHTPDQKNQQFIFKSWTILSA